MMRYIATFVTLCALVLTSCKKDSGNGISHTPEITMVAMKPQQVVAYQDSIVFTISYIDGDGDLGENANNVYNAFLTDERNNVTYKYRIQQLAPTDADIAIQGTLDIILDKIAITDTVASETTSFSIYVVDRAGNTSNTVTSPTLTISP